MIPSNPPDFTGQKFMRDALTPEMFGKLGKNTMSPDIHNPHGVTTGGHSGARSS